MDNWLIRPWFLQMVKLRSEFCYLLGPWPSTVKESIESKAHWTHLTFFLMKWVTCQQGRNVSKWVNPCWKSGGCGHGCILYFPVLFCFFTIINIFFMDATEINKTVSVTSLKSHESPPRNGMTLPPSGRLLLQGFSSLPEAGVPLLVHQQQLSLAWSQVQTQKMAQPDSISFLGKDHLRSAFNHWWVGFTFCLLQTVWLKGLTAPGVLQTAAITAVTLSFANETHAEPAKRLTHSK